MVSLTVDLGEAYPCQRSKSYAREHSAFFPAFPGPRCLPASLALVNLAKSRRDSQA